MIDPTIRPVYLNASSTFFPNGAVNNDAIEDVLGVVGGGLSRSKKMVLASNKIHTRHYAIDPVTRKSTHTNAEMTALAVQKLFSENPELDISKVGLLACGTSSPDLLLPAHGQMVHGELKDFQGEVVTTAGVCCSGTSALKLAIMSLRAGELDSAIVTGSEAASKFMRGEFFNSESAAKIDQLKKNPMVAFEHDFLRWMLSDGAAALYLSTAFTPGANSFRINWIEGRSFANEEPVCMLGGGVRDREGKITAWKDKRLDPEIGSQRFAMNIQQDIRQLRGECPGRSNGPENREGPGLGPGRRNAAGHQQAAALHPGPAKRPGRERAVYRTDFLPHGQVEQQF